MFHFKLTRLIFNVLWLTDSYQSRSLPLTTSLLPGLLKATNRTNLPLPTWGNLSGMRSLQPQLRGGTGKKQWFFRRMQRCLSLRWADQCTNSHDYAKQTLDGVYVGQNLYMVKKIPRWKSECKIFVRRGAPVTRIRRSLMMIQLGLSRYQIMTKTKRRTITKNKNKKTDKYLGYLFTKQQFSCRTGLTKWRTSKEKTSILSSELRWNGWFFRVFPQHLIHYLNI